MVWGGGGEGHVSMHAMAITPLIPFTDWAHNAHHVFFERSKNVHCVPSL